MLLYITEILCPFFIVQVSEASIFLWPVAEDFSIKARMLQNNGRLRQNKTVTEGTPREGKQ